MSGLQLLGAYLTEVVKEILRVVEEAVTEYREEAARTRRENQSLRSQLRDVLLLEARAEWPRAGPFLEHLSLSDHPTVTPPIYGFVPTSQVTLAPLEQQQRVSCSRSEDTKSFVSTHVQKAHSRWTTDGPGTRRFTTPPATVKEELEERGLSEEEGEESRREEGEDEIGVIRGEEERKREEGEEERGLSEGEGKERRREEGEEERESKRRQEERGVRDGEERGSKRKHEEGGVRERRRKRGSERGEEERELSESEGEEGGSKKAEEERRLSEGEGSGCDKGEEKRGRKSGEEDGGLSEGEERGKYARSESESERREEDTKTEETGDQDIEGEEDREEEMIKVGEEERESEGEEDRGSTDLWDFGLRMKTESEYTYVTERTAPPVEQVSAHCPVPSPHNTARCPRCSDTFPSGSALLLHLQQPKKSHGCDFCCKSFAQSADLRRHLRTHTGERPHRCGFCARGFSQRGNLRRHLRIHTGERPYVCAVCGRRFSDGDTLKKHQRTHN